MKSSTTEKILHEINDLPILQQKEIYKSLQNNLKNKSMSKSQTNEKWRESLLSVSVWSESEIDEIKKAEEYVNQWNPDKF